MAQNTWRTLGRGCRHVPFHIPPWYSAACSGSFVAVLQAVTLKEIEQVFEVLERLDISREAIVIPLKPAAPGSVRRLANGKFEIVIDSQRPLAEWLVWLEAELRQLRS